MPNRVFKDQDLRQFMDRLRYTAEGQRYVERWNRLNKARAAARVPGASDLERRSYIRLSDATSDALSDLERRYHWPP